MMLVDIDDITGSGTIKPGVRPGLIKTEQVSANRHGKYHPVIPSLWQKTGSTVVKSCVKRIAGMLKQ